MARRLVGTSALGAAAIRVVGVGAAVTAAMSFGLLLFAPAALASGSDLGPRPSACTATTPAGTPCTYNSRDGALTFTPSVVKVGGKIVAAMVSPPGVGNVWTWTDLPGLTAQACAPSAPTCTYVANAETGTPGARYAIGTINGGSVQSAWTSAQAYAVDGGGPGALPTFAPAQANGVDAGGSAAGGSAASRPLDVRGLWDGYYIEAAGGARYHNPVVFQTEDFSTGRLTGTDNGTDGPASVAGYISGRTIHVTITQPPSYSADATWALSADGTKLVASNITDPNATHAFVLYRHGPPVGALATTSGAGVTSGPAPITALPTPGQAFSAPARVIASAAITVAAVLLITFPANLFNKTFEENYDVIAAWWEPKLRRFRRKPQAESADNAEHPDDKADADQARRERNRFGLVVVAGAVLGGLLNPKFGANSASVNSFIATLLAVLAGTAISAGVGLIYRKRKHYDVTKRFEALPAGLAIGAVCVVLSRVSDFQPGYLYGIVCGVAFAGALAKNESAHLIALGHLATVGLAVIAWFLWVPVNHAAVQHAGVFPLVILDDLLASLFVGGLVGSVISLIPVRFMPGHALASWHRGVWMAVFGVAAFGLTEIVLFPSQHNHAGHAPLVTIIVLFVLFGGGSLVFRDYFARRAKRLEPAAVTVVAVATSAD